MPGRRILSPTIFTISKPSIVESELRSWAHYNGLDATEQTPIALLLAEIDDEGSSRLVEFAGRHCYRSWKMGRGRQAYLDNIIDVNHGSVLEHANFTFAIQGVSRTLTHELVRHRVGVAISQESQRYVDAKDINFVIPPLLLHVTSGITTPVHPLIIEFEDQCFRDLDDYTNFQSELRKSLSAMTRGSQATVIKKRINEASRSRLPNAAETRLTWTVNVRTLRHFLEMRGADPADLEIRRLACHIHDCVTEHAPAFFTDFVQEPGTFGINNVVRQYYSQPR